jgi:hypothetical protein
MMRELTLANAMQNIRVMKYLYMATILGGGPWRWSLATVLDNSPVAMSTIRQSPGNVSYLTPASGANPRPGVSTEQPFRNEAARRALKGHAMDRSHHQYFSARRIYRRGESWLTPAALSFDSQQ